MLKNKTGEWKATYQQQQVEHAVRVWSSHAKSSTLKEVFWLPVELHQYEVITSTFECVILLYVETEWNLPKYIKTNKKKVNKEIELGTITYKYQRPVCS